MNKQLITKRCRRLRRNQTKSERELWEQIKNRQINGLKFLRQHPLFYQKVGFDLYYFIADFYCAEMRIVIELDGGIHDEQKEYDDNRDAIIKQMDLKVQRFKNNEIEKAVEFIRSLS